MIRAVWSGNSYSHGTSSVRLIGQTIGQNLRDTARRCPDRDALIVPYQNVRLTYGEFDSKVDALARSLLAIGIDTGDRIGIWSPNNAEWVLVQYAAARIGAILVNLNPAYRAQEIHYALGQSRCRLLFASTSYKTSDYVAMIDAVRPHVSTLERVVFLGTESWGDLLTAATAVPNDAVRRREAGLQFDDPVNIQYTSGTTGSPKGATLSHHNILNNGYFVGEVLRYTEHDRICLPVPFYHCFGCVLGNMAAVTHGSTVVIPGESFDPGATLQAIQDHGCTSIYGVPTMFIAQLDHPRFGGVQLETLRTGIMAGAPCPIDVMRQVIGRMHVPQVTICYGMTETSPVSFQSATDDPIELRVSTVGRVLPHLECKIVDPDTGATVPRGTPGELCTRGYAVMLGYWNDDAATANAIDAARWMHSGDLAVMNDEGYVSITGRIKDMIIRGGENIYPREIEEFLHTHEKVSDVQVIGVPDDKYGEEVCAWIRLRDGVTATAEEFREFCRGQIATYKIPRYVRFTSEFPMTVTGKVQKFKMRELTVAELTLARVTNVEPT